MVGNSASKRTKKAELVEASDLSVLKQGSDTRVKSEQLELLNRRVKNFEAQVAREERKTKLQGNGDIEAANEVNDKYIQAIEAKLKILDQL